ncbi:prolyl oligopeptidase family serine peptidase [Thalassotalea sp. PLHSN55]|uniref:S9 family peptidase n=1 Tax=Thalassotalea sp. PLHSN55 TaxID=3435888 RepID=UPI003F830C56
MKLKLITTLVAFSLTACTANDVMQSTETPTASNTATVTSIANKNADVSNIITLEQIMSDPDWFARSPESWYWGDDSNTIFYQQKRAGNPVRDLFSKSIEQVGNGSKTDLARLHVFADKNAVLNQTGTKEAYVFQGNVFVKDLKSGDVQQLTYTSAIERNAMFLTNGNVAYRVENRFFEHSLVNNSVKELANLTTTLATSADKTPSYIANEQHKLIEYVALQKRNRDLKEQVKEQLKAINSTLTQTDFNFGKNKKIVHASLSPAGDKMIISLADKGTVDKSDIMPNYIADDGHIKAQQVRARVADNRKYSEELFLLDLKTGMQHSLGYQTLPGFDDDVLAEVRLENYKREGKSYHSQKAPRNIHVIQAYHPIKWHEDGKHVAIMLEAWDNKDRWLATVNFNENKLVNQHRLHDDAWINWTFNEFGWLNDSDRLYYLSEESGYSHLYVKSLHSKARRLTTGKYEVSDLTLSQDEQSIYFRANKKHPGIYEIYQVDIEQGNVKALTDLGGNNNYALSPDESKLLIEHSTVTMPPELYVQAAKPDATATRLTHTVSEDFLNMPWSAPQVVAIASSNQSEPIYSKVYLPKNFDVTAKKNRAVMFSHGAGYLQNSHLGWSGYFREFMFHSMLVQQGYVVIDMDYRASKGYGRDWRTAIYRHMGKPEVEDMVDGVNWLVENANVDSNRVGTYGGSYGGFLTLMSMFTEPELFQSGSALRLVSDWAYYNHGYTSNILNTPEDDAIAYERSSPIYFAEGLQKPLLINAPMVDDNVFFQDTVRLVQRLIELEKQDFETAIYPVEPHGFVQPSSWLDEYRRIYKLFENTL